MHRAHFIALLFLALSAQSIAAQHTDAHRLSLATRAAERPQPALEHGHSVGPETATTPHSGASVRAVTPTGQSARHGVRGITHYFGGALLGGWIGFVGAQVTHSDWERQTAGQLREQRATWAIAGATAGLIAARLLPSSTPTPVALPERGFAPPSRTRLDPEDIRNAGAANALELIRGLRPEWLVTRGINSWRETPQGSGSGRNVVITRPADPTILVYLNGFRLGGIDKLQEVTTQVLSSVEYLDPHSAVLRFGGSAAHGAILLTTSVDAP
jgi:hypothetical protein